MCISGHPTSQILAKVLPTHIDYSAKCLMHNYTFSICIVLIDVHRLCIGVPHDTCIVIIMLFQINYKKIFVKLIFGTGFRAHFLTSLYASMTMPVE